ncbi:dihydrodipicolinate synthase family protein [Rhodococcus fascians]|nr:dihydrodipicolinate synthase family protein [Rhodococcus fascians]MBY3826503.1 dihydrodipicolinate synthase family protein [Rhodococcus fascians]MBY3836964.1 dihydrodipicolinate synthase family protein [Rhodococcus fascians]MBY3865569.1 dihydrodipicolinate synthase family protein [Rhodococcus fascians]MBY3885646.1 dihydrodipicolinate synthase family protein [Rhodococcus fascians]
MSKLPKISGKDMRGVMAYPPTPALPGAERVDATDTVDLVETERMIRSLISDGVDAIALNGTLGEMATLTLEEWKAFATCAAETAQSIDPDFPLFIGATTLNTRDTISRMRFLSDLGVTGTLLGRPMWGEMVVSVMDKFYRDVATAVPEMAIVVYDNTAAFRGIIPRSVYKTLIELPQVVAVKYAGGASVGFRYHNDMAHTKTSFPLMSIETDWFPAWEMYGEELVGMAWSSTTAMGPGPVLELRDALQQGRYDDAKWLTERLRWAHEPFLVGQDFMEFAKYNIPLEKMRVNEAGYINVGKSRVPYTEDLVPEVHAQTTSDHVKRYMQIRTEIEARFGVRASTLATKA